TGCSSWFGGQSVVGVVDSVRVGGKVSRTVTALVQVDWWPAASVAVKVTVVVPSGYGPDASPPFGVRSLASVAPPQTWWAVAVTVTYAPPAPWHSAAGSVAVQSTTGGVVSATVTVVAAVLGAPLLSVTFSVMACAPSGSVTLKLSPLPSDRCVASP